MEENAPLGDGTSVRVSSLFAKKGDRQIFTLELRPGQTTIVSWKKLMKDANKVNGSTSAPELPTNAHPALESRLAPDPTAEDKVTDASQSNRFSAVIEEIERLYMGKESSDEEDLLDVPDDEQYDTEDSFIDDADLDEYFEVDNSGEVGTHYMHKKDGSSMRPKISVLEKGIRELEKMVVESRPPAGESQEADTVSQAVKRRLPREIKLKLDKVARIAASHGKVSKDLVNRLMSILGHLIQLRTLKRHLKVMISMSMSAKQEKDNRFEQIKEEVVEMIKVQGSSLLAKIQQQGGAFGDGQEFGPDEKPSTSRKLSVDTALEDKICDLYDLFVDGLDEDAGPQVRKFYAELAQLWPNGCMDNHEIKHAISRAKERRKALYNRHKDQDKVKRKNILGARQEENLRYNALHQNMRERHTFTSVNRQVSNTITTARAPSSSMSGPKQEKVKGGSSNPRDNVRAADGVIRKKVKGNAELESERPHIRPEKLGSLLGEERPKILKHSAGLPLESNFQPTSIPSLERSS